MLEFNFYFSELLILEMLMKKFQKNAAKHKNLNNTWSLLEILCFFITSLRPSTPS